MIISGTALSGFLASKFLLYLSFENPSTRYPLAFIISYFVFLLLMYLWMDFLKSSFNSADKDMLSKVVPMSDEVDSRHVERSYSITDLTAEGVSAVADDIVGSIATLLFLFLAIGAVAYFILDTLPIMIVELFLTSLTASLFNTSIRKFDKNIFVFSVLKSTLIPAIFICLLYFFLGKILTSTCPGSVKISDLFTLGCIK